MLPVKDMTEGKQKEIEKMSMNKNDQEYLVQKIRTQYTERQHTELDTLKALDRKVKIPASIFAYTFGTVSALIMGSGMSLIMTDIGEMFGLKNPMVPGIVIGILGFALAGVNYLAYKKILNNRRKKYADEIITLSNRILEE